LAKVRVFSLAKELGLKSSALVKALGHMGVPNLTPASAIDEDTATAVRELLAEQLTKARERAKEAEQTARAEAEVARAAGADPASGAGDAQTEAAAEEEIKQREEGLESLEREMADHGFGPTHPGAYTSIEEIERHMAEVEATAEPKLQPDAVTPLPELAKRPTGARPDSAVDVAPVVTVLGHVDHGKTALLDALRSTNVVADESGGITQHIGASEVEVGDKRVVFIDTPGHEAFTAIRARGAQINDITVLVIAADDGIMPQTVEAINHAKAADVPIIVAINKCDLPAADPERAKQQLLEHELVPEEWGGDTIVVEISAITKQGLDDLLDMVLLVAEVQELWADSEGDFVGVVIETGVATSEGAVATVLIRNGTLRVGDSIVAGAEHGRVRRLRDWRGKSHKEMGPGRPVEIIGLGGTPDAGEIATRADSPKAAREAAAVRQQQAWERDIEVSRSATLRELFAGMRTGETEQLNVIIKADVYGSAQALESKLLQLDSQLQEVDIEVIYAGVGPINESDVMLARASDAIMIGFHVQASDSVRQTAEAERVEIRIYDIIYEVIDDIIAAASGLLKPVIEEPPIGKAEVLQIFRGSRVGVVAGCRVTEGKLQPGAKMVVVREGEVVYEGTIDSLRHFDQDVSQIEAPGECGVATRGFRQWQVGDIIEASVEQEVERRLSITSDEVIPDEQG